MNFREYMIQCGREMHSNRDHRNRCKFVETNYGFELRVEYDAPFYLRGKFSNYIISEWHINDDDTINVIAYIPSIRRNRRFSEITINNNSQFFEQLNNAFNSQYVDIRVQLGGSVIDKMITEIVNAVYHNENVVIERMYEALEDMDIGYEHDYIFDYGSSAFDEEVANELLNDYQITMEQLLEQIDLSSDIATID